MAELALLASTTPAIPALPAMFAAPSVDTVADPFATLMQTFVAPVASTAPASPAKLAITTPIASTIELDEPTLDATAPITEETDQADTVEVVSQPLAITPDTLPPMMAALIAVQPPAPPQPSPVAAENPAPTPARPSAAREPTAAPCAEQPVAAQTPPQTKTPDEIAAWVAALAEKSTGSEQAATSAPTTEPTSARASTRKPVVQSANDDALHADEATTPADTQVEMPVAKSAPQQPSTPSPRALRTVSANRVAGESKTETPGAPRKHDDSADVRIGADMPRHERAIPPVDLRQPTETAPRATVPATSTGKPAAATDAIVSRSLSIAQDGQWLDSLAKDIASTATGSTLHFRLDPVRLGSLSVRIEQSAEGAVVRLDSDKAETRQILTDAQPRLVAEARAQGLSLKESHVGSDSPDQRPSAQQNGSMAWSGEDRSQGQHGESRNPSFTRPQPMPAQRIASTPVTSTEDDALYA